MNHDFLIGSAQLNQAFESQGASGCGEHGNGITRRSFVKRTGAATVAVILAANLAQKSFADAEIHISFTFNFQGSKKEDIPQPTSDWGIYCAAVDARNSQSGYNWVEKSNGETSSEFGIRVKDANGNQVQKYVLQWVVDTVYCVNQCKDPTAKPLKRTCFKMYSSSEATLKVTSSESPANISLLWQNGAAAGKAWAHGGRNLLLFRANGQKDGNQVKAVGHMLGQTDSDFIMNGIKITASLEIAGSEPTDPKTVKVAWSFDFSQGVDNVKEAIQEALDQHFANHPDYTIDMSYWKNPPNPSLAPTDLWVFRTNNGDPDDGDLCS